MDKLFELYQKDKFIEFKESIIKLDNINIFDDNGYDILFKIINSVDYNSNNYFLKYIELLIKLGFDINKPYNIKKDAKCINESEISKYFDIEYISNDITNDKLIDLLLENGLIIKNYNESLSLNDHIVEKLQNEGIESKLIKFGYKVIDPIDKNNIMDKFDNVKILYIVYTQEYINIIHKYKYYIDFKKLFWNQDFFDNENNMLNFIESIFCGNMYTNMLIEKFEKGKLIDISEEILKLKSEKSEYDDRLLQY